jgi:hypothetical protein
METEKLYVVRLYDGFDHLWMDVSDPLPYDKAKEIWLEKTNDGRTRTKFSDIDYYKIFPADTRMLFSHENIVEGRI